MHGNPEVGRRRAGRLMRIFMPPFFPHLFVSAYQTDQDTVTRLIHEQRLGACIRFQKWHHCTLFFSPFPCNPPNQSNPDSQLYAEPDVPIFKCVSCELGYRDNSRVRRQNKQSLPFARWLLQTARQMTNRAPLYLLKKSH